MLAVASLGAGMASGRYERRAARQGIAASSQSLETAARLSRFGQVTGAVGNVISIIDAFSMLADAEKAERQGELSQFTDTKYLLVGVNVVGAVVGLIFSSALVVPLLISLFAIWIAGQIIHYVPLGIRVWVRRSIFGVPGRQEAPFASLEEEQESLEMVIRGISVDIDVIPRWGTLKQTGASGTMAQVVGRNRGEEPYYVDMKINLPKRIESDIDVEFVQISNSAPVAIGQFSILDSEDEPRLAEETSSDRLKRGGEESLRPSLTIEDNGVLVAWNADLKGFPEKVRLALVYHSNSNFSGARDVFEIDL